jgi:hypothetical protein
MFIANRSKRKVGRLSGNYSFGEEKMLRLVLANLQEMTESIPMQFSIPILVFALVLLLAFCSVALMSKRRSLDANDLVFASEAPAAYRIPDNYGTMESRQRREVTIKNLYLNHGFELERIAGLLELDQAIVQGVLAKSGNLRRKSKV